MFLIDSHCHLEKLNYNTIHLGITDVINKAKKHDVKLILSVCTTLLGFYKTINMVGDHDEILFSCGIHPLNLDSDYSYENLLEITSKKRVIAIGETGLDYLLHKENKLNQQQAFREHVRIGIKHNKPVIVHTRTATKDTIAILKEENASKCSGVLHCFTEDITTARALLDLGFYISFSGIITFRNSQLLRKTACYVPLDRILIETDSPYLSPIPYRGKENQPAYVRNIAEFIANLKGVSLEVIAEATTNNFYKLFHLNAY